MGAFPWGWEGRSVVLPGGSQRHHLARLLFLATGQGCKPGLRLGAQEQASLPRRGSCPRCPKAKGSGRAGGAGGLAGG